MPLEIYPDPLPKCISVWIKTRNFYNRYKYITRNEITGDIVLSKNREDAKKALRQEVRFCAEQNFKLIKVKIWKNPNYSSRMRKDVGAAFVYINGNAKRLSNHLGKRRKIERFYLREEKE